jgi:hypothetical protein
LHQSDACHVDKGEADADEQQQDECRHNFGPRRDQCQRHPPEQEPDCEVAGEPPSTGEARDEEHTDGRSDSDHPVEPPDAGGPDLEHFDGENHHEDVEHPGNERLCREEHHQDAQARIGNDRAPAREKRVRSGSTRLRCRHSRRADSSDEHD